MLIPPFSLIKKCFFFLNIVYIELFFFNYGLGLLKLLIKNVKENNFNFFIYIYMIKLNVIKIIGRL